jgi:hypothetical protein
MIQVYSLKKAILCRQIFEQRLLPPLHPTGLDKAAPVKRSDAMPT